MPLNPSLTGLVGQTTVVGSQTYVIIINPTSVPIVTPTGSGSSNTSAPLQITGLGVRRKAGFGWLFTAALGIIITITFL